MTVDRAGLFLVATALLVASPRLLAAAEGAAVRSPGQRVETTVPGGPEAIRRLLGLDPGGPLERFYEDVHRALLAENTNESSWRNVEHRLLVDDFASTLALWRENLGDEVVIWADVEDASGIEKLVGWFGFQVERQEDERVVQPDVTAEGLRLQRYLQAIGVRSKDLLAAIRAKRRFSFRLPKGTAPAPYGLEAWRGILDDGEGRLSATTFFDTLLKDVTASRMLVALASMDPRTREEARRLSRRQGGPPEGWRLLYNGIGEPFFRLPAALRMRDGKLLLPGGPAAVPLWEDAVGDPVALPYQFLQSFYSSRSGKAAYVADALWDIPEEARQAFVLGKMSGEGALKRFRRLYQAIERAGENFNRSRKDPYDFFQLVHFLRFSDEGELELPGGCGVWREAMSSGAFPSSEAALEEVVRSGAGRKADPDDVLRRLFRGEVSGAVRDVPAQKAFLIVSALVRRRPALAEPGTLVLLYRGVERFVPMYAALDDLEVPPPVARRYLLALDRLDRAGRDREDELRAGLFQASVEILAGLVRSGTVPPLQGGALLDQLLARPVFARAVSPAEGVQDLLAWLLESVQPALRAEEAAFRAAVQAEKAAREDDYRRLLSERDEAILARRRRERAAVSGPAEEAVAAAVEAESVRARPLPLDPGPSRMDGELDGTRAIVDPAVALPNLVHVEVPEPAATIDALFLRALTGRSTAAAFAWKGGGYRFDPASDELTRRQSFVDKQRAARLADLSEAAAARRSLLEASGRGDAAATAAAAARLGAALGADAGPALPLSTAPEPEPDVARKVEKAKDRLQDFRERAKPKALAKIAASLGPVDDLAAERLLDSLLLHVYAAMGADPTDLFSDDPYFVRRHLFSWDERLYGTLASPWMPATIRGGVKGDGGARISGALAALPDVLGQLHAEQLIALPGAFLPNEYVKAGIAGPVRRMSASRLDDDAMRVVDTACRLAEGALAAWAAAGEGQQPELLSRACAGLVPAGRLSEALGPSGAHEALAPSDFYLIGRRLQAIRPEGLGPDAEAACREGRSGDESLLRRLGPPGRSGRLAEFGPRPATWMGAFRLVDVEMPSFERLAEYRVPMPFADRIFDLKIHAARLLSDARLPAALLPVVLEPALDDLLTSTSMAYASDWRAIVRRVRSYGPPELERWVEGAITAGRITREER